MDVTPKVGRVLLFQQRMLWHSGEEVTKGLKYTLRTDLLYEKTAVNANFDEDKIQAQGQGQEPKKKVGCLRRYLPFPQSDSHV